MAPDAPADPRAAWEAAPRSRRAAHISVFHKANDSRIFYKECRSLAAAGWAVAWVAPPPMPEEDTSGVLKVPVEGCTYPYRPGTLWRSFRHAWREARRLGAGLYHFHDVPMVPLAILLRLTGAKVVYDIHEDAWPQAVSLGRESGRPWAGVLVGAIRWALEVAAKLTLSGFVAATPHIAAKFPRRRTLTGCNFPRREEIEALGGADVPYRERPQRLVYVGSLTGIRGAAERVRALEERPGDLAAELTLVGDFPIPELREELSRRPGWQKVDFRGWQDRRGVLEALGGARVGLVVLHPRPNYQLAYPVKLFEYMAAGLPVVASDFPLWRSFVDEARCGLLVDPLDPAAVAAAVEQLLRDPEEAQAMGRRGRRAVEERWNWDREAEKIDGLYRRLLGADPR